MDELAVLEPETALASFRPIAPVIQAMLTNYSGLKISGLKDRAGFDAVHKARMEVKMVRVGVEKTRKTLKSAILLAGQAIDGEAARLTAQIEPLETHLQAEEDAVQAEKERIRQAEENARKALIQVRIDAFRALKVMPPIDIADMTEEVFQVCYAHWKVKAAERDEADALERKRLADEQEAARQERIKLDAERAALAEQKRQQDAENARIAAEQEATRQRQMAISEGLRKQAEEVQRQQDAQKRAFELEAARKEAADRAIAETEARMKREGGEADALTV